MFYPDCHATSSHVFTRGKYMTNDRFMVWIAGPLRRPVRRRNFPHFMHGGLFGG